MSTTPIYHTLALLHTVLGEHDKVILCMFPDEMFSRRFGVFLCVCGDGGEGGGEREFLALMLCNSDRPSVHVALFIHYTLL